MKIRFLCLAFFLFFFSCGGVSEKNPDQNEAVGGQDNNGDIIEDKDCATLSSELPDDVIAKFDLVPNLPSPQTEFYKEASSFLKEHIPPFIDFHLVHHTKKRNILDFEFSYEGTPLCSSFAKIYPTTSRIVLTGNVPPKTLQTPFSLMKESPPPLLFTAAQEKLGGTNLLIHEEKVLCYLVEKNQLKAVWKHKVEKNAEPYKILADGEVIHDVTPLFFHATGSLKTYIEEDNEDTKLQTFKKYEVEKMSRGGTLCSARFHVIPQEDQPTVLEEDFNFHFDPKNDLSSFEQVSMFAYASLQSNYIKNLKHTKKWYGPQILLIPDMREGGITNLAQYVPGDEFAKPEIRIPNGDNEKLYQIRIDNEAIQHEVGHHVLFRAVTEPRGESLVIHEGVADAFVQLRTKNSCLGEHLCVSDLLCISLECLRSADNDYTLNGSDLPAAAHLQSQLISGLLWDLALKVGHKETAAWLNYAIDLLPRRAYFDDFIIALFNTIEILYSNSEEETFDSYCESLMEVYEKRGFLELARSSDLYCAS